ncbi:ODA4, partial [Symbiodinium sp. KB8]
EAEAANAVADVAWSTAALVGAALVSSGPEFGAAPAGSPRLTESLARAAAALAAGAVPAEWRSALKALRDGAPAAAVAAGAGMALQRSPRDGSGLRWEQAAEWGADHGGADGGVPPVFWWGGLFRHRALPAAVAASASLRTGAPLDETHVALEVLRLDAESVAAAPAEGVFVSGIGLDGAGWEIAAMGGVLVEPNPDGSARPDQLPLGMAALDTLVVHMKAVPRGSEATLQSVPMAVLLPGEAAGEDPVMTAHMRSRAPAGRWTLAGAAAVLVE